MIEVSTVRSEHQHGWVGVAGIALLVFGCVSTPGGGYEQYEALEEVMEDEIEAVVEKIIPTELRKAPDAVDFARIEAAARKAAYYFHCANDKDHPMYEKHRKIQRYAEQAESWFTAIGSAAQLRDVSRLKTLYGRHRRVCTTCHD